MSLNDFVNDFELQLMIGWQRNDRFGIEDHVVDTRSHRVIAVLIDNGDLLRRPHIVRKLLLSRLRLVVEDELLLLETWNVLHKLLAFIAVIFRLGRCLWWRQMIQLHSIVDGIEFHQQLFGLRRFRDAVAMMVDGGVVAGDKIEQWKVDLVGDLQQLCKRQLISIRCIN